MGLDENRLNHFRTYGDNLADEVVSHYFPDRRDELQHILEKLESNGSSLPQDVHPSLNKLFKEVYQPFSKQEEQTIVNGQAIFSEFASDFMLMLGFYSLPYCYAAAKGAEVLVRSKRILTDPEARLLETAEFVFDITNPKAFSEKGQGFVSILKVRLIHAVSRWYILDSKKWSLKKFDFPVNQEDMVGTNLSFSLIPIRGLRKIGLNILPKQAEAYINFWSLIGQRLGVDKELLPQTNKEAYLLEKKIRKRQFAYSKAAEQLTKTLLSYFDEITANTPLEGKSKAFVQFLVGDSVSEQIGIQVDPFKRWSFRPMQELMKLKNILLNKEDNYLAAFYQFRAQKNTQLVERAELKLPNP